MKYIITENQNNKISVLRRIDENWAWITEIVEESLDFYDTCDIESEEYLKKVCIDSSRVYLLCFFENDKENGFKELFQVIINLIKKRLGEDIMEFYNEKKEDCPKF